jgi:hypothetical protein
MTHILTIYGDTDTVWNNAINKSDGEWNALGKLIEMHKAEKIKLVRSLVAAREIQNTRDPTQRAVLLKDYNALDAVKLDEKVLGIFSQNDQRGGTTIVVPMVSDVQDETTCCKLQAHGIKHRDASI